MDSIHAYDSDESLEVAQLNTTPAKEYDFFGLNDSRNDDELKYCEHNVLLQTDDSCWNCTIQKYEDQNLNSQKTFGPHFKHSSSVKPYSTQSTKRRKVAHSEVRLSYLNQDGKEEISASELKANTSITSSNDKPHRGCVNEVQWHPSQNLGRKLLSCSMDGTVKVWDVDLETKSLTNSLNIQVSKTATRSAKWTKDGNSIITGDYDCNVKVLDSSLGKEKFCATNADYITSVIPHPTSENLIISGSKNVVACWDARTNLQEPVKKLCGNFGQVQDMVFINEDELMFCTDTVERESADRSIIAWHFSSGSLLSNQIYHERYCCTSLKVHPDGNTFMAQSSGNYVAVFSTDRPYKMNKKKRYGPHQVAGYGIKFDISPDGKLILTGSADGNLHYYDYHNCKNFRIRSIFNHPLVSVSVNPHSRFTAVGSLEGLLKILN